MTHNTWPTTYPLATKIRAVTPINDAKSDKKSLSGTSKKDNVTMDTDIDHNINSNLVNILKFLIKFIYPSKIPKSIQRLMVGMTGFEPAASSSRTKRATKLRHIPITLKYYIIPFFLLSTQNKNYAIIFILTIT